MGTVNLRLRSLGNIFLEKDVEERSLSERSVKEAIDVLLETEDKGKKVLSGIVRREIKLENGSYNMRGMVQNNSFRQMKPDDKVEIYFLDYVKTKEVRMILDYV